MPSSAPPPPPLPSCRPGQPFFFFSTVCLSKLVWRTVIVCTNTWGNTCSPSFPLPSRLLLLRRRHLLLLVVMVSPSSSWARSACQSWSWGPWSCARTSGNTCAERNFILFFSFDNVRPTKLWAANFTYFPTSVATFLLNYSRGREVLGFVLA